MNKVHVRYSHDCTTAAASQNTNFMFVDAAVQSLCQTLCSSKVNWKKNKFLEVDEGA